MPGYSRAHGYRTALALVGSAYGLVTTFCVACLAVTLRSRDCWISSFTYTVVHVGALLLFARLPLPFYDTRYIIAVTRTPPHAPLACLRVARLRCHFALPAFVYHASASHLYLIYRYHLPTPQRSPVPTVYTYLRLHTPLPSHAHALLHVTVPRLRHTPRFDLGYVTHVYPVHFTHHFTLPHIRLHLGYDYVCYDSFTLPFSLRFWLSTRLHALDLPLPHVTALLLPLPILRWNFYVRCLPHALLHSLTSFARCYVVVGYTLDCLRIALFTDPRSTPLILRFRCSIRSSLRVGDYRSLPAFPRPHLR